MSKGRGRRSKGARAAKAAPVSRRTRIVWGALLASMASVYVLLWGFEGAPTPRADGLSLPPLVAAAGPSSIEAIFRTAAPQDRSAWRAIVIHHSGSAYGSAATIDSQHRAMNLNGLGYHFVIGNGSGAGDGELHVGERWLKQLPGAHVAGPDADWFNRNAVGVCLVGDGRRREFTPQQMRRLVQVVSALCERFEVPADRVYLHSDLTQTDSPGRFFPEAAFREQIATLR